METTTLLANIITAETKGRLYDGLSSGHIKSTKVKKALYPDPTPYLKGKLYKWRKPGLYSSVSQFTFLLLMQPWPKNKFHAEKFLKNIQTCPELGKDFTSFFRDCDRCEQQFINNAISEQTVFPLQYSSTRIILPAMICALKSFRNQQQAFLNVLNYTILFTLEEKNIAGNIIAGLLLIDLQKNPAKNENILERATEIAKQAFELAQELTASIFALKLNPATIEKAFSYYYDLFKEIAICPELSQAEEKICQKFNKEKHTEHKKGTTAEPALIIPYTLAFIKFNKLSAEILSNEIIKKGGNVAVSLPLTMTWACALNIAQMPSDDYFNKMLNKNKVQNYFKLFNSNKNCSSILTEFQQNEKNLTLKEDEERKAMNRHQKKKGSQKTWSKQEQERQLAKHVVESWTKEDQARYKKEKRHQNLSEE